MGQRRIDWPGGVAACWHFSIGNMKGLLRPRLMQCEHGTNTLACATGYHVISVKKVLSPRGSELHKTGRGRGRMRRTLRLYHSLTRASTAAKMSHDRFDICSPLSSVLTVICSCRLSGISSSRIFSLEKLDHHS